ncbi:MAG: helix-hairpin-helix domain-containing protein [Eubacterium sp.]|nr:helix-hairpin-helix domain-containing protein [Eubacterium sp.]
MQDIRYILVLVFILIFLMVSLTACSDGELEIKTVGDTEEPNVSVSEGLAGTTTDSGDSVVPDISNDSDASDQCGSHGEKDVIYVYVCGAVVNEGVYEMKSGSRKADALDAAGGYSENAAHGMVNLAAEVSDGERIYIPTSEEAESNQYDNMMNPVDNMSSGEIDINTASKEELMSLSGIGESKALDIISYRESHGGFSDITDIKNVSGIGDATYEKIKEQITVR